MALSIEGWFYGITAMIYFIVCINIGTIMIYKSRKHKIKLLTYLGLTIICSGLVYLYMTFDFLLILITGRNLDLELLSRFTVWGMFPLILCFSIYISLDLLIPKKKWHILSVYIGLGIIYYLFLLLDPSGSITRSYPERTGEHVITGSYKTESIIFFIVIIGVISILILNGFGFFYKGLHSIGIIRKKFFYLSLGYWLYILNMALESSTFPIYLIIVFIRLGLLLSILFLYLGLREEPEKKEKYKPKKEIKVEGDLFRLAKYKKEDITEEEVSISKERKICLVCKGKVARYNIYICPECDTFYCEKCANALENLENSCWACGDPIDESKPVKLFKKEEEEIQVEKP